MNETFVILVMCCFIFLELYFMAAIWQQHERIDYWKEQDLVSCYKRPEMEGYCEIFNNTK